VSKNTGDETIFTFDDEFDHLVKSIPGIMWVDTLEEERFIEDIINDIRKVVAGSSGQTTEMKQDISLWLWSLASGLNDVTTSIDPLMETTIDGETSNPVKALDTIVNMKTGANLAIYIMRGLGDLMKMQPMVPRKIKDVYKVLYKNNKIIIITATNPEIPISLDKNITYYLYKAMDREKISKFIDSKLTTLKGHEICKKKGLKVEYNQADTDAINNACQGLSENEMRKILNLEFNKNKEIVSTDIVKEKKRIIEKSGILEYWEGLESMDNVGGLNELKPWLAKRKNSLSQEAINFGLPVPRGVLIVGVPGCGKSLACKATASVWELPLVRLDVGKVMGGIVGASESNMRKVIDTVESIAPCCLWLDEIEKNLSGSASSNYSDSGTLSRVFGTFATWLQEKKSYVFVLATANDISQLPPELTRKGRLDETWFVSLPTQKERKEIFEIQIRKYGRDPKNFDLEKLSKIVHKDAKKTGKTYKYSGAEIEEALKDALYTVFDRDSKSDITTQDIEESLKRLVPISKSEEDRINKIISDGEKHYRPASSDTDENKTIKKSVNINL